MITARLQRDSASIAAFIQTKEAFAGELQLPAINGYGAGIAVKLVVSFKMACELGRGEEAMATGSRLVFERAWFGFEFFLIAFLRWGCATVTGRSDDTPTSCTYLEEIFGQNMTAPSLYSLVSISSSVSDVQTRQRRRKHDYIDRIEANWLLSGPILAGPTENAIWPQQIKQPTVKPL
jgi:hypothetical protein